VKLPALREELVIQEGPRLHDGQPSWTLHDPSRNRFFRLDWLTFEIVQRWSLEDPELIAHAVGEQTPLQPGIADVKAVLDFAGANQLLHFAGAHNSALLADHRAKASPSWWEWLVHNYLFFRIPLIKPAALLNRLHRVAGFLFLPAFWAVTTAAAVVGFLLVWRQWDAFRSAWVDVTNLNGVLGYAAVLVGVKILHEFGHGLVATHFDCRVPTMGMAFLVMTPMAYTDTNEAWKLTARGPRLWIGAAGMLAELSLAAWATLAWGLLPDGYARSVAFVVATTTWVKSILVNTSPIMRFDGYYLLSDALDIPNLHHRAFALARWQLREWLFALGEPAPEAFRTSLRRGLVALAMFIWAYRLVVFTGIAVFVYHFFFKALGLVLFTIEIGWFVVLPICSEANVWVQKRKAIMRSPRRWGLGVAGAVILAMILIPLPQRVRLIGELSPKEEFRISAPESARLREVVVRDGEVVKAGQLLAVLDSDALRYRLEKARAHEASSIEEVASAEVNPALRARLPVMQKELEMARAARRAAETAIAELRPTAPFPGTIRFADAELRPGEVLARQEPIATVVGDKGWIVEAYVDEQDAHLVSTGMQANLYLEGLTGRSARLRVLGVEADATRSLTRPMLTSPFGGPVQARVVDGDLIPERAVFRVTFEAADLAPMANAQVRRGRVLVQAGAESLAGRWSRNALSVMWRELGF
jgi:putative peptide zinc metalloprotease protein